MSGSWYLSPDGECYNPDEYAGRDEAILAGIEMYEEVSSGACDSNDLYPDGGDFSRVAPTFWVGKKVEWWPAVDEDGMLDCVIDQAYDYAGELADGWLEVTGEEREKLRDMLQEAFDKWLKETANEPTFFMVCESSEIDPRACGLRGRLLGRGSGGDGNPVGEYLATRQVASAEFNDYIYEEDKRSLDEEISRIEGGR